MRYLGIDFGTKRVGVAISDERGILAFPKEIFKNDSNLIEQVIKLVKNEEVAEIVVGESKNFKNQDNPVAKDITDFTENLKTYEKIPIHTEKEFFTSVEARRLSSKKEKTRRPVIKRMVDSRAAALILQRYLDKINKKQKQ